MKIGFERQELLHALQTQERNQMTVAYYLILDHKRRKMLGSSPIMHATHTATAGAAGVAGVPPEALPAPGQQPVTGQSPQGSQHVPMQMGATAQQQVAALSVSPQRPGGDAPPRRWHLGVQSSLPPADMMLEIFRALRALQFEWKIVAQYSLKCRPCTRPPAQESGHSMIDPSGMAVRCKVKVGLNLYKIHEESYLLDIRKVDGEVLPFMDVCSLLLSELKL